MDIVHHKVLFWHIICILFYFVSSEAAILGGRPKRVSEEDVSARFFYTSEIALLV